MSALAHRPLLGLRRQPGRLALWFMRLPRPLYRQGWGRVLGHTFLLITHEGRKTGRRRETVTMALAYEPATREAVVCSAWGPNTEWMRNLRAHPALQIQIGRETFVPKQHFLTEDEAFAVASEFRDRHPGRLRLFATILGWGDLGTDAAVRELVRDRPFVSFRPVGNGGETTQKGETMSTKELANEPFVSITTFKRDGTRVSTPVWVAGENGSLLVITEADSWKVKRIRRDGHIRLAPCTARGAIRGEAIDADATIDPDTATVETLLARKYGWQYRSYKRLTALTRKLRGRPEPAGVTLRITPR
jgi:PPOX class probable F420-dependent enzyme/deazaflavin-dependent oxidoreductase (nitroreductase family)